ncbi:MAG TPA: isochorismatase family protein [Micropepsaceae bacterium]|jgi:nicotinamidase-related amidase|nr:isochorismatase family protein [Micropepsaceae bacterium]
MSQPALGRSAAMLAGALTIGLLAAAPVSADVIGDWNSAVVPPPPELKDVTIDPSTTALLILDLMKQGCGARPRCVASVPNVKRLHDQARAKGMMIWYSLVGSNGKATPDDVIDASIKPRDGEWYRAGGPDKFLGSTLQAYLKQRGIKTVIVCGTSFQGVGVGVGSGAAQRGYKVIIPVDCLSSEDAYHEQYAAFHLAKGGPAGVTSQVTLTRSTMIKF